MLYHLKDFLTCIYSCSTPQYLRVSMMSLCSVHSHKSRDIRPCLISFTFYKYDGDLRHCRMIGASCSFISKRLVSNGFQNPVSCAMAIRNTWILLKHKRILINGGSFRRKDVPGIRRGIDRVRSTVQWGWLVVLRCLYTIRLRKMIDIHQTPLDSEVPYVDIIRSEVPSRKSSAWRILVVPKTFCILSGWSELSIMVVFRLFSPATVPAPSPI